HEIEVRRRGGQVDDVAWLRLAQGKHLAQLSVRRSQQAVAVIRQASGAPLREGLDSPQHAGETPMDEHPGQGKGGSHAKGPRWAPTVRQGSGGIVMARGKSRKSK